MRVFFQEHIHADDEVRFVLEGTGNFDVRDGDDRWIRIAATKGDFINMPKGIFHRFSLDEKKYLKCMRMFAGDPVWTAYFRGQGGDEHPARKEYVWKMKRLLPATIPLTQAAGAISPAYKNAKPGSRIYFL